MNRKFVELFDKYNFQFFVLILLRGLFHRKYNNWKTRGEKFRNDSKNHHRRKSLVALKTRWLDYVAPDNTPQCSQHDEGSNDVHNPGIDNVDRIMLHDIRDAESRGNNNEEKVVDNK